MDTMMNSNNSFTMKDEGQSEGNQPPGAEEKRETWPGMAQRIFADVSDLMTREGELVRTELTEKINQVKSGGYSLLVSGVLLLVGVLGVAATGIVMINLVAPLWLSALIITLAFLLVGGVIFAGAKRALKPSKLRPHKSLEALTEIRSALKEKVHEITKH